MFQVSGKMYEFKNVMAIKLNLKDDPRKEKKPKVSEIKSEYRVYLVL